MRVIADHLVYRNPHPNNRSIVASAPTLAWSRLGSMEPFLLSAFRVGQAKMSLDGRVMLRASRDGGRTWNPLPVDIASPFARLAEPQPNHAGVHMGASREGTTVLMACRFFMVEPGDPEWDDDAAGVVGADCLAVRAGARGAWEGATTYDFARHTDEWAIPCGPPLALGDGRWIFPMERHARAYVPEWLRRYHAFAVFSSDDGRTWGDPTATLNDPDERLAYYDQRMVAMPGGRILTMAWIHDVVDDVTLTARAGTSDDGGRTWSEPYDTGILGGPINPVRLADGRILATYARRTAPRGIRGCLSEDGGRTWAVDDEIVLWDEGSRAATGARASSRDVPDADVPLWGTMWGWTFGGPTPVQLPDGTVAVTFFATGTDGVPAIRCVLLEV
jgi:hypothetical protein